jgi:hypothetical protein
LSPGTVLSADADWRFVLGDPADADSPMSDDGQRRTLTLPNVGTSSQLPPRRTPRAVVEETIPPELAGTERHSPRLPAGRGSA